MYGRACIIIHQGHFRDTHVTSTVHSYDESMGDPTALSVNAASCALHLSSVPWRGPVGCVRVGIIDGARIGAMGRTRRQRVMILSNRGRDAIFSV